MAVAENPEDLKHRVEGRWHLRRPGQRHAPAVERHQLQDWALRQNVPARKLSMNVATIPPGGVAYAHIHVDFDVMLYILQGRVRPEYGPGLTKKIDNETGDFIYIEPGVPHEVFNLSDTEPVVAVVARSDPSEWENIIPYDRTRGTSLD